MLPAPESDTRETVKSLVPRAVRSATMIQPSSQATPRRSLEYTRGFAVRKGNKTAFVSPMDVDISARSLPRVAIAMVF